MVIEAVVSQYRVQGFPDVDALQVDAHLAFDVSARGEIEATVLRQEFEHILDVNVVDIQARDDRVEFLLQLLILGGIEGIPVLLGSGFILAK